MAQATNTQLGEIILTGDLAGNGGTQVGTNPQLKTIPGLVPGSYTIPNITVDAKGRVVAIANGGAELQDLVPSASATRAGVVSIGDNLFIEGDDTAGYWTVNFGGTLAAGTATGLSSQGCAQFGFDLQVDSGAVQKILIAGSNAQTAQNLVNALNAKMEGAAAGIINGNIVIASTTPGKTSKVKIDNVSLFACMTGFLDIGSATKGVGACELYAKRASTTDYGVVKVGAGINVDDGVISVDVASIPAASVTTLGGVIVPTAGHLVVAGDGSLSVPTATSSTPGVVTTGTGLTVTAGALAIDVSAIPSATTSTKGLVQAGTNLSVAAGVLSIADATASVKGVAKIGAGLTVAAGVVSAAIASTTNLGAIKIGTGLAIDGSGVVSTTALPDATTSTKGIVQIGAGINVASGVISVAKATASTLGVVQVGTGLSVTAGGVLSAPLAQTGSAGVISGGAAGKLTVSAGLIDIVAGAVATTNSFNTFSAAQTVALVALGSGASVAPNLQLSNNFSWTPSAATATMTDPTNPVSGGVYTFIITTTATTTAFAFPSTFKFAGGVAPKPINGITMLTIVNVGGNYLCSAVRGFV